MSWIEYFPEQSPREFQRQVLDELIMNWDKYDNFVLELPTGVGKSAIAIALARWWASQQPASHMDTPDFQKYRTYITTTSIGLQNQYEKSYLDKGLVKLYSADNYMCCRGKEITCKEGAKLNHHYGQSECTCCPYVMAKYQFIDSPFGILNLAYYLNETYYVGELVSRGLCIYDEAHTIGDCVKEFVSLEIPFKFIESFLMQPPAPNQDGSYHIPTLVDWMSNQYLVRLNNNLDQLKSALPNNRDQVSSKELLVLYRHVDELEEHTKRLKEALNNINYQDWVAEKQEEKIVVTPISPRRWIPKLLTSRCSKNLMMTATILDEKFFLEENGLPKERTLVIKKTSPFPTKNRPIYYWPIGRIKHNDLQNTVSKFIEPIVEILEEHSNEKGIIFVSSYAQAEELKKQLNNPRLITHTNADEKDSMMELHQSSLNTVIISPSMHEGVDLKGDLSRFQIVVKLPFPSLGSKSVKRRSELYPEWYAYRTCVSIVQSIGRSVRSDEDYAVTYILDDNFGWFSDKCGKLIPKYCKDSMIGVGSC